MAIYVAKFGGSSLADAEQFKKVKGIIEADTKRRYVVPSAPGKRDANDIKITDMLYTCAAKAKENEDFQDVFASLSQRYTDIIAALGMDLDISKTLIDIYEKIKTEASPAFAASRGEYLNGLILAEYLGFGFFDPADAIFFDDAGKLDMEKTNRALSKGLMKCGNAVIPGFYGSDSHGNIKTFSRGGSDISGAIVASAVGADLYENWTDVSGFLMADPRIVTSPRVINVLTYSELRELAYMGATVLHEDSIFPVRHAGIPINVRNTNRPSDNGTMIVPEIKENMSKSSITGVAGKKNFTVITIEKDRMNTELGFVRKVLSCLEKQGISFEHMPTGIDSISLVIADNQLEGKLDMLTESIREVCAPDTLLINDNMAIIATVGHGMIRKVGISSRLFGALATSKVNIRMIDQGSSEMNIIIGVENDDFEKAVNAIYYAFVS